MYNKIEQNGKSKISNILHSILYSEQDPAQISTKTEAQIKKEAGEKNGQGEKIRGAGRLKTYILFSLTALFLCSVISITLFVIQDMERMKRIETEYRLEEMTEVKNHTQLQLDRYVTKTQFLEDDLTRTKGLLAKSKDMIKELLTWFEREKVTRVQLEKQLSIIQSILISAMKTRAELEDKIVKRTTKENKISLAKVIDRTGPAARGTVLIVNKKDCFVVVGLGKEDDVEVKTTLAVYRGNAFVGRLSVTFVEEKVSMATMMPSWRDIDTIKEGDSVKAL